MKNDTMKLYCKVEESTLPIRQVVTLLSLIADTYELGSLSYDDYQKINLINGRHTIDEMLLLAQNTLNGIMSKIEELNPNNTAKAAS